MKRGDLLFLDTNVLLGATDRGRPDHESCRATFAFALQNALHLVLSGQIIREYLSVATRGPEFNGLGLNAGDALRNVDAFRRRSAFLEETLDVSNTLCGLVRDHRVVGKQIHDANIAATMIAHSVDTLVTANTTDFAAYGEITVMTPAELMT